MPYKLYDDSLEVISYSVPLILNDGTIYGVLGVEISLDYLQKQLPNTELLDNEQGSYLLGLESGKAGDFQNILINGMIYSQAAGNQKTTQIVQKGEDYVIKNQDKIMYADAEYIDLYGENTEFTNQKWAVIGIVPMNKLLVFSGRIIKYFNRCCNDFFTDRYHRSVYYQFNDFKTGYPPDTTCEKYKTFRGNAVYSDRNRRSRSSFPIS